MDQAETGAGILLYIVNELMIAPARFASQQALLLPKFVFSILFWLFLASKFLGGFL